MPKKISSTKQPHILIDKNMRDYSKEPAFVKADERAAAFLKKHPLPKEFTENEEKPEELVTISKSSFIALIARDIKGRSLFPKKVEEAKRILERARFVKK
ncbi:MULTISPECIES: hypothetical protein [Niastella]|uniref:Uncharacterized protein n=1 Tax=Niastella soli TaxID=2821487 RepID=A0ABS3YZF8_9BACT|nr:hypothetical protein [Niastella soli]MBO9203268.1 hypothetical protein [Niastella soli]